MSGVNLGSAHGKIIIGTDQAEQNIQSLSDTMRKAGTAMSLGVTAPLVGIAATAINSAADFEQSMNIMAQVSGATADQMAQLQAQALEMGAVTSFSAGEAAEAQLELAKAGMAPLEAMAALPGVLDAAAAGGMGLAQSASLVSGALNAFGLDASESANVANQLAAAANASAADMSDLGAGLQQGGFAFAAAGQNLDDLNASLAILSNVGLSGSDAGTALKNAMMRLMNPTKEASGEMAKLGINVYDAQGQMLPWADVIQVFSDATADLTDEERNAALGTILLGDGMKAMIPLLAEGKDGFLDMKAAVNAEGSASSTAGARMKGMRGAVEYLMGSIDSFLIGAALPFLDSLGGIVRVVADGITAIGSLPRPLIDAALAFGAVLAAAGPVMLAISGIATALAFLASPLGLVVIAVAAVAAGFVMWQQNFGNVQGRVAALASTLADMAESATGIDFSAIADGVRSFGNYIGAVMEDGDYLNDWLTHLPESLQPAAEAFGHFVAALGGLVQTGDVQAFVDELRDIFPEAAAQVDVAIAAMREGWTTAWDAMRTGFDTAWQAIQPALMAAWAWLQVALPAALGWLQSTWTAVWPAIQQATATAWEAIRSGLTAAWVWLQETLPAALTGLQQAWAGAWPAIQQAFTTAWDAVRSGLTAAWAWLQVALPAALAWLQGAWGAAWPAMQAAWDAVWPAIQTAWTTAQTWLETTLPAALTALQTVWNAAWPAIQEAVGTAWQAIQPALTAAWAWLQVALPVALAWLRSAWETAWPAMQAAWDAVWTPLSTAWTAVKAWLDTTLPDALTALKTAWDTGWPALQTAATTAVDGIKGTLDNLKSAFTALQTGAGQAQGTLGGFWVQVTAIGATLAAFFAPAIERLQTAFTALPEKLAPLMPKLQELGGAFMGLLQSLAPFVALIGVGLAIAADFGINALTAVLNNLPGLVGPIIDQVTATLRLISTVLTEVISAVQAAINGDWDAVWESAKTVIGEFNTYFRGLFSRLGTFLGAVGRILYEAIVDTLKDMSIDITPVLEGIRKTFDDIWTKVKGYIQPVIDLIATITTKIGEFKDYLGSLDLPNPFAGLASAGQAVMDAIGGIGNAASGGGADGDPSTPQAIGTSYFRGGTAQLYERGYEQIVLPAGSRIYTNGQTNNLPTSEGKTVNINLGGVTVRSETDARRLVDMLRDSLVMAGA